MAKTTKYTGTQTEKNLQAAFAGESQARNKYTYFASMAKKEGYEQLAAIFEETAGNEKEHAKIWFKLLCGGAIPDTLTCLDMAAGGEHDEWTEMYPRMAKEAKEEGFNVKEDEVQHLDFWKHGIKFFNIVGPNDETVEFCEVVKG